MQGGENLVPGVGSVPVADESCLQSEDGKAWIQDGGGVTTSSTDDSQVSSPDHIAPGNVVFEINGRKMEMVVRKEDIDLSLEPGEHPLLHSS